MAFEENENEVEVNSPSYDDLLCAFKEPHDEMKKMLNKIILGKMRIHHL